MKIGIFGGTFDPIHLAHLAVAEAARDTFGLDRVLVIPAARPPHKAGAVAAFEHRFRMVELACEGRAALEPSMLESGADPSYSIRTIEKVRAAAQPADSLYFIIGADAFAELGTWRQWEDVIAQVEFVVVTRPSSEYSAPPGARVHPLCTVSMPISSSAIRARLQRGERPPELCGRVYDYIRSNNLYR